MAIQRAWINGMPLSQAGKIVMSRCSCNCCERWNAFADKHYRPLITENRRLHGLIGLLYEYKALVQIGSAEAVGEAEARIKKAEDSDSTPKCGAREPKHA